MAENKYIPIIGLEIHVQLSTKTKLFCGCPRKVQKEQYGMETSANTDVCPICLGYPGAMPHLNTEAVEKAIRLGLGLGCKINELSVWDRKNYFYPDLFNGYQISQLDHPLNYEGKIALDNGKIIRINRAHLENDAAKSVHEEKFTGLDGNKSGSPLVEIVSEPDLRSADEAKEYAEKIRQVVRWVNASDADMYLGEMRFDINISLCVDGDPDKDFKNIKHTPIVEVKNRNSFKELFDVINYEIQRQTEEYDKNGKEYSKGSKVTMGWNEAKGKTFVMREKEESDDYRYFQEPDISPLKVTSEMLENIKASMPKPMEEVISDFVKEYSADKRTVSYLVGDRDKYNYFQECVKLNPKYTKNYINWIASELAGILTSIEKDFTEINLEPKTLVDLVKNVAEGKINQATGKDLLKEFVEKDENPDVSKLIEERGIGKVSDTGFIEELVKKAIEQNPKVVADIKSGKDSAKMFIVGIVMRESKGKADVNVVREILDKQLS